MENKYYRYLLLLVFAALLLPTRKARAQSLDSTFIETYNRKARINGGLRYRNREANFSVAGREDFKLINRGLALRLGGRYKWFGYTFSVPLSDLGTGNEAREGRSFGLGLQFYRPKFYILTRFRKTDGFFSERADGTELFREDVSLFTATIFGFHVLNFRKFSLRSSFKQKGRQLRDSGSLLIGGLLSRQALSADGITLPLSEAGEVEVNRFSQEKVGIGIGYAYTHLFSETFYFTPMAMAGPEFRFLSYDLVTGNREREQFRVSPRIRARLALGYNGPRNYAAITAAYLPSLDATDNFDTRIKHTEIELRVGRRL